jgi:uncharacterized protein YbaP (TraB family)
MNLVSPAPLLSAALRRSWRGRWLGLLACGALGLSWTAGPAAQALPSLPVPARADYPLRCPPVAQPPTADQLHKGQAEARDRGFLWRISKDGRTSYLYGTIHVGKMEWSFPGPSVREALRASHTVALELDPTDATVAAQMQAGMQARRPVPLPAALRERLDRQASAACIPRGMLGDMHPVMQVVTYTVLVGRWDGLDPAWAQEVVLAGLARSARLPIVSLETAQRQARLLIPDDRAEVLLTVERALVQLEQGRVRPMLSRMAAIWERGDLDELERFESWCECMTSDDEREAMRRLLDERNPDLADGIAAVHARGGSVFAAVGALHMVGPTGLPRLMAHKGFRVERVGFVR